MDEMLMYFRNCMFYGKSLVICQSPTARMFVTSGEHCVGLNEGMSKCIL